MLAEALSYLHLMSLALWFGGLFAYVAIVWPSAFRLSAPDFPRATLATIGTRSAPWIYLAMVSALASYLVYWLGGFADIPSGAAIGYLIVLLLLIANNVYGSLVTWPRIMLSTGAQVRRVWRVFHARMAISLVVGLGMLSVGMLTT